MPITFFAHQAPVLPLKMKWPHFFSGQALVLGSMSPDFEFFLTGRPQWRIGHTLIGQFTFCLPLTLLMVWIVSRIIARPLARHLPDAGPFHLHDYQSLAETTRQRGYWLKAIPSALLGSFSHLWWDSFTHTAGWSAQALGYAHRSLPLWGTHSVEICKIFQYGSTLVGGSLTLFMLYHIGKRHALWRWAGKEVPTSAPMPSLQSQVLLWFPPLLVAPAAFSILWQTFNTHHPAHNLAFWSPILLLTSTLAFIGLCLGCLLSAWQSRNQTPSA
jgi:hypothetical protein